MHSFYFNSGAVCRSFLRYPGTILEFPKMLYYGFTSSDGEVGKQDCFEKSRCSQVPEPFPNQPAYTMKQERANEPGESRAQGKNV